MTAPLRFRTRFLYFVLLWCVCSFKVFLGGVGEAGLRVDDLLIAIAFISLMWRGDIVRIPRSKPFRAYLVFISVSLCSAAWNGYVGRVSFTYSMLFVARLLEYMIFYYLGYMLSECGVRVWRGLKIYFYVLCVLVVLQTFHLVPTFGQFGASRASGNTNGPYELAAVASFFFCAFMYRERKKLHAGISLVLLLLTASRITTAGIVVVLLRRFIVRSRSKLKAVVALLLAALAIWTVRTWIVSLGSEANDAVSLSSRLNSSSRLFSGDYAALYASIPVYETSEDYISGAFLNSIQAGIESESDASGMIRAFRWSTLIKSALAHYDSILIGLGPSFGSAAIDGYFVRVFVETGLAGLATFLAFLRVLTKSKADKSGAFREFVLVLIVTACFIDIFSSYKAMLLLWLWSGMNEYESRTRENAYRLSNAS